MRKKRWLPGPEEIKFMRGALREARRAAREDEVPVGAVLVRDGRVVARAHNRPIHLQDPTAHAEVLALRRAGRRLGQGHVKVGQWGGGEIEKVAELMQKPRAGRRG